MLAKIFRLRGLLVASNQPRERPRPNQPLSPPMRADGSHTELARRFLNSFEPPKSHESRAVPCSGSPEASECSDAVPIHLLCPIRFLLPIRCLFPIRFPSLIRFLFPIRFLFAAANRPSS